MNEWEPATEAEVAMRDALRAGDQELYFRILARSELLLPVSTDALAGRSPVGWGTWTTGSRTHVLAFTSTEAMQVCLSEHAGSARRVAYHELAAHWPNLEWWLAVDPGLPIEGYLPAWFVSQLARGDIRLPGRTLGARARVERVESFQRARAVASVPGRTPAQTIRATAPVSPAKAPASPEPAPEPVVIEPEPVVVEPAPAEAGASVTAASVTAGSVTAGSGLAAALAGRSAAAAARATLRETPAVAEEQPAAPEEPVFVPANETEASLLAAADEGNTDSFLSTLLLAKVLLPLPSSGHVDGRPGDSSFVWRTETIEDHPYVVVFTSEERLVEHLGEARQTVGVRFAQLIRHWPDEHWSFAVNPGTPVGAKLPGNQIVALANWAAEVGLGEEPAEEAPGPSIGEPVEETEPPPSPVAGSATASSSAGLTMMQKPLPPGQVSYYLERGYDRVSGFVQRANELAHLRTPAELHAAVGLDYAGSPFDRNADELYVLRWAAHRPSLYRIPYGGPHEAAMQAMQGWVIERAPFRGNGFAPSETGDVIAEFKVDSARLPHGAQLWRVRADGTETLIALLDADGPTWRRVDGTQ